MKLEVGKKIEDFAFCTQNGCKDSFLNELKEDKNVLLFLRYIGCTVCSLAILEIKDKYKEIKANGVEVYVVLQSDPEVLAEEIKDFDIPFEIIVDPEMKLYEKFSLERVEDIQDGLGGKTMDRIAKANELGLEHGKYEGDENQLPATFVLDKDGVVTYAKYGEDLTDTLYADDMINL